MSWVGNVFVFDNLGEYVTLPTTAFSGISGGGAITYNGADGNIYVADDNTGNILVFTPLGTFVRQLNQPLSRASGIAFSPNGALLYIANQTTGVSGPGAIVEMTTSGTIVTQPGAFPGLTGPISLAVDPTSASVYVADHTQNELLSFDPNGRAVGSVALPFSPTSIALDPNISTLYTSSALGNSVAEYTTSLAPKGTIASQNIYEPGALAFDPFYKSLFIVNFVTLSGPGPVITQMTTVDEQGNTAAIPFFINIPQDIQAATVVP